MKDSRMGKYVKIIYENYKLGVETKVTKGEVVNITGTQIFIENVNGCLEIISHSDILLMAEINKE